MAEEFDFSGEIKEEYQSKPLPTEKYQKEEEKKQIEEYIGEHNKHPKMREYHRINVDSRWHTFLTAFFCIFVVFLIFYGAIFLYLLNKDKFKSEISQSVQPEINSNTENNYNFSSSTQNQFTNQFNITIAINNLEVVTNST